MQKPTARPSASSAIHDVPLKCSNQACGNRARIRRSPHQSSIRATSGAWSAVVGGRNVMPAGSGVVTARPTTRTRRR